MINLHATALSVQDAYENIFQNITFVLSIIAIACFVQVVNYCIHYQLNYLGIYPRRWRGLPGILLCPWLHGNAEHLFLNAVPFFILSSFLLATGRPLFIWTSLLIILLSGILTWLLGRRATHIGASSLIMGYWAYLLMASYHQRSFITISLALVCLYYFASFILGMFPGNKKVSWEGHFFGFISGLIVNYISLPTLTYLQHYFYHY